jgi:hypothetical protein
MEILILVIVIKIDISKRFPEKRDQQLIAQQKQRTTIGRQRN